MHGALNFPPREATQSFCIKLKFLSISNRLKLFSLAFRVWGRLLLGFWATRVRGPGFHLGRGPLFSAGFAFTYQLGLIYIGFDYGRWLSIRDLLVCSKPLVSIILHSWSASGKGTCEIAEIRRQFPEPVDVERPAVDI